MDDSMLPPTIAELVADLRVADAALAELAFAQLNVLGTRAIPWLLAALKAERTVPGRFNLGEALAQLGMVAWEPLLTAARDTDDLDFGWSVAWALPRFQTAASVDDFLVALRHPNVHVRWAAALALGDFGDARAVAPLVAALAEDGPVTHRLPYEVVPENYHRKVRLCAATSLRQLGQLALPALLDALRADNPRTRAGAANALTGMDAPYAFAPLVAATRDPDADVRRHAFQALAALIPTLSAESRLEACDVFLTGLFEHGQYAQLAAVKGLCALGEPAVTPLTSLVRDRECDGEHPLTRYCALRALASLLAKDPPILSLGRRLFALLEDTLGERANPPVVRAEAARALGLVSDPRAVEPLLTALADPSPMTRTGVAEALRTLGDPRAVPALLAAWDVARAEEADAREPEVLQYLLDALEEATDALRSAPSGE